MAFRCCFVFALIAFMAINAATISGFMMVGGWTGEKKAIKRVQRIAEKVKSAVVTLCKTNGIKNCDFPEYKAVSYKSQVVAGTNYIIKVQVDSIASKFIVIKVFVPLPYTGDPPELETAEYTDE